MYEIVGNGVDREGRSAPDLLASLTTNLRPNCDLCESKCSNFWFKKIGADLKQSQERFAQPIQHSKARNGLTPDRDRKGQYNSHAYDSRSRTEQYMKASEQLNNKKSEINVICHKCYYTDTLIPANKALEFEEVSLVTELNTLVKSEPWSIDDQLHLLEVFEECNMDLAKVLHRYPSKSEVEVVKNFFQIPIQHFKHFAKLTNQHFENIFKKDSHTKQEALMTHPIFDYVK